MLSYSHTPVVFAASDDASLSPTTRVLITAGTLAALAAMTYVGAKHFEKSYRRLSRRR